MPANRNQLGERGREPPRLWACPEALGQGKGRPIAAQSAELHACEPGHPLPPPHSLFPLEGAGPLIPHRPAFYLPPGGSSSCDTRKARRQGGCGIMTGRSRLKGQRSRGRCVLAAPLRAELCCILSGCPAVCCQAPHQQSGSVGVKSRQAPPANGPGVPLSSCLRALRTTLLPLFRPACAGGAAACRCRLGAAGHCVQQRAAHATNTGCDAAGASRAGGGRRAFPGGWVRTFRGGLATWLGAAADWSQLPGARAQMQAPEMLRAAASSARGACRSAAGRGHARCGWAVSAGTEPQHWVAVTMHTPGGAQLLHLWHAHLRPPCSTASPGMAPPAGDSQAIRMLSIAGHPFIQNGMPSPPHVAPDGLQGSLYTTAALDGQTRGHLAAIVAAEAGPSHTCCLCLGHNKGWEEAASALAVRAAAGCVCAAGCSRRGRAEGCAAGWQGERTRTRGWHSDRWSPAEQHRRLPIRAGGNSAAGQLACSTAGRAGRQLGRGRRRGGAVAAGAGLGAMTGGPSYSVPTGCHTCRRLIIPPPCVWSLRSSLPAPSPCSCSSLICCC